MRLLILSIAMSVMPFAQAAAQESDPAVTTIELPGQVFLRNEFLFTGDRHTGGASSSFISKNGEVYILTAKHLLGPDMGVQPAVKPTEFDDQLEGWIVYHNDGDDILAYVTNIVSPNNDEDEDVILLKTDAELENVKNKVLPITQDLPEIGSRLFAIGCPYSEGETCKQNIYPGTVEIIAGNIVLVKADAPPDSISGFSGAALVNEKAEIVAVIYGGGDGEFVGTFLPDWIFD